MKRNIIASLLKWKNQSTRKPLILKGVRQVGKTHLLKNFGKDQFPNFHYVDFEKERDLAKIFKPNLDPKRIINELNFYLKKAIDIKNDLVIFDEIQACPDALTSLKYFCEDMPGLALCAAGSLLGIHLNSGSYPVGKTDTLTLHPISFTEFIEAVGGYGGELHYINNPDSALEIPEIIHTILWEHLKRYFIVGGLPEVVNYYRNAIDDLEDFWKIFQTVREKQNNLIKAYYADMTKHSGKINAMHLDRIWSSVPSQLAQVQDGSSARFRFKGVIPGINRHSRMLSALDWLEGAGLITKVHMVEQTCLPLAAYTKEGFFKLFMFDVGILGAMNNLSPSTILNFEYGTYKGFFAENFVAQEFLAAGANKLFSWQGKTSEIEFLCEVDNQVIPVETKSGTITKAKSLHTFVEKYHPPYSIILSGKNLYFDEAKKIYYYPLYCASQFPFSQKYSKLLSQKLSQLLPKKHS